MAKGDSAVNKSGPRTKQGGRLPSLTSKEYLFGSEGEIEDRDPNKSLYSEFLPNTNAPAFSQIKPESGTGRNVNRAGYTRKSGSDLKFSSGPGRP
jgi:hypothetical protein